MLHSRDWTSLLAVGMPVIATSWAVDDPWWAADSRRLALGGQAKVAQYAAIAAVTPVNTAVRDPA